MSTSTDAILAYGYDLGGGDPWKFTPVDGDGVWLPDWLVPSQLTGAQKAQFDEDGELGTRDLMELAQKRLDDHDSHIQLVEHCSSAYPSWILAVASYEARRGGPVAVPEAEPGRYVSPWYQRLVKAQHLLGITCPGGPAWLLASWTDLY